MARRLLIILMLAMLIGGLVPWSAAATVVLAGALALTVVGTVCSRDIGVGLFLPFIVAVFPIAWSHGFFAQCIGMWRRKAQPNIYG